MMSRPPAHRRKRDPYARQVLGIRVNQPIVIVGHALHVLREIDAGNYRHIHRRGWHLHIKHSNKSTNVNNTVTRLIKDGYLTASGATLSVTAVGRSALDGA